MTDTTLDLTADIIDVRDIIARYEELEAESDGLPNAEERYQLSCILSDLKGCGGDEKWRGDWYPLTLIRDHHFTEYAQELAEEIGAVDADAKWPQQLYRLGSSGAGTPDGLFQRRNRPRWPLGFLLLPLKG